MNSYTRILINHIHFNGLDFFGDPNVFIEGGFLVIKEFSFFEIPTISGSKKYANRHGSYVSPTMKDNRRYRLLFDIVAENEEQRRDWLMKVQQAFSPETNPYPTNPNLWKQLSFIDPKGITRQAEAQVSEGGQLSDFANEKWVGYSVELIGKYPEVFSQELYTLTDRNHLLGFRIPFMLPFKMDYVLQTINYQGNAQPPIDVKITATIPNPTPLGLLTVYVGNGSTFSILQFKNIHLDYGDVIEIDGMNQIARLTKQNTGQKTNITGLISLNSVWPVLQYGDNIVAVDCEVAGEALEIEWKRRSSF